MGESIRARMHDERLCLCVSTLVPFWVLLALATCAALVDYSVAECGSELRAIVLADLLVLGGCSFCSNVLCCARVVASVCLSVYTIRWSRAALDDAECARTMGELNLAHVGYAYGAVLALQAVGDCVLALCLGYVGCVWWNE